MAAGVTGTKEYQKPAENQPRGIVSLKDSAPARTARSQPLKNPALAQPQDPLLRQPLPLKLQILKEIFSGVQTVYDMLRRRNRRTTFANLKAAVEEASGRRFEEGHLHQLHTLLPEYLSLDTITLLVSPRTTRTERHTLVTLSQAEEKGAPLRTILHSRLAQHLLDAYASHLRSAARESHAAGDPVKAVELEKEAQQREPIMKFLSPFPEGVPEVGAVLGSGGPPLSSASDPSATDLSSSHPVNSGARVTFSSSVGQSASDTLPAAVRAEHASALAAIEAQAGTRRLSFAASAASKAAIFETFQKNDEDIINSMPEELRRRTLDGIISVESLRVLEVNEAVHKRMSTKEAHEARIASAALGALPRTFGRLRRIFGQRGPNAMKLNEVIAKIKQGGAETSSQEELLAQVQCLAEHAPEFVEIKAWGQCGTPAVWINRKCDGNAVMKRLTEVAERRQSVNGNGSQVEGEQN